MTALLTEDDLGTPVAPEAGFGVGIGASFDASLMARALACLFAAGATLVLLTVALPHSPRADVPGLLLVAGNAYLVASVLLWRARALPARSLPLALAWGSTLITGVAYFSAESPSPLVFFYLWVFLYSAYFFTTTADGRPDRLRRARLRRAADRATAFERSAGVVARRHGHAAGRARS